MTAASAPRRVGGSCLAATRKMYDAASPAVRFANTGPEGRLSDCRAALPRWASTVVIGCQSFAAETTAVGAPVFAGSTRAYQYHAPTSRARITSKQPSFRMRSLVLEEVVSPGENNPR